MGNHGMKNTIKNLLVITAGSLIYAAGVSLFLDPNHLAPGGVTGIAIILTYFVGLQTGTWYFLINLPIVLLGFWRFGLRFIIKTFYAVAMVSVFTNLLAGFGAVTNDLILASLSGSVMMAVGIGLIFKTGATTGGTDIIIKVIRQKARHLKTGFLFQCFDVVVVICSGLVFRNVDIMLYALLTVMISGKVIDYVLYGPDEAKMIYIITENPEEIGQRLLNEMEVGCTYIQGKGGWTDRDKQVIMCAVHKKMTPQVEEIVKAGDPKAFMILTNATEIFGEGYKDIFADKL